MSVDATDTSVADGCPIAVDAHPAWVEARQMVNDAALVGLRHHLRRYAHAARPTARQWNGVLLLKWRMAQGALIEVASLLFQWPGARFPCLDIETLSIDAGQRVFLFGPSGSGKSTLLALLAGVVTAQQGSVRVLGTELSTLKGRDRFRVQHVGFIFQQFNLVPYLSVLRNVLLPCQFSATRAQRATEAHGSPVDAAIHLLDAMGLGAVLRERKATELSVGQQQRVAAARALIGAPELIVADEPTSSLDADARQAFLELLERQCDRFGSTLLFVSHDRQLAATFDRQINLPAINRVVPDGSTG